MIQKSSTNLFIVNIKICKNKQGRLPQRATAFSEYKHFPSWNIARHFASQIKDRTVTLYFCGTHVWYSWFPEKRSLS